ncbi:ABC transporter permease [Paenibacillus alkalitolerans]|uniref:ABC transporter permease n=1 Tax=Paenibacillus alkalitolerans TaxID=2799335 RepID=UPI0018F44EE0|nr:ABC transporter permease [Paenibacillus alkalitolerans]
MKRPSLLHAVWPPVTAVMLFLLLWQVAVWVWDVPKFILPGPVVIAEAAVADAKVVARHAGSTLSIAVSGLAIGCLVGMGVAVALHFSVRLKSALSPLLVLSQNVPIVVLATLLVVWFGFGILPKLILITLVCFFPVAVAMMDGLVSADRGMCDYMRMLGATRWQTFAKLEFPWSLPSIFSGLKIAAAYSVLAAVFSEWVGSKSGMGYYLQLKKTGFQVDRMFVAVIVIVVLSWLLYGLMVWLERATVKWRRERQS